MLVSNLSFRQVYTPYNDTCPEDALFIGPNDLALALLGYTPAKYTETVFLEAIDKVVLCAHKNGKKVGILAVDGNAAKKAKERFDFVVMSADVRSLQAWYKKELEVAKSC